MRTPSLGRLTSVLGERGATVIPAGPDSCRVSGLDAAEVGTIASTHGVTLHELSPRRSSLEEVYTQLTEPESEYVTGDAA